MSARILLVEDEADLARSVAYSLGREGFSVVHAATGRGALEASLGQPPFDLVLLDLMLPDMTGTEVCRRLRAEPRTRDLLVLMLTARADEIDRVVGFEVGADDYVVKPFSVRELALRIRALLRRGQASHVESGLLSAGPFRIDLDGHRCWVEGEPVALTAIELRLLAHLIAHRGRVQSRDRLLDAVWGDNKTEIGDRTVDAHIKRMREKLGEAGVWVETLRGVGYRFVEQAPAGAP